MWSLVSYLGGMAIVGVGMVLARLGYRQRERRSQLVTTPPTVPGSVTERGVVVALTGFAVLLVGSGVVGGL